MNQAFRIRVASISRSPSAFLKAFDMRMVLSLSNERGEAGVCKLARLTAGIIVTISKMAKLKLVVLYGSVLHSMWAESADL
jgi:hypothetical protein